MGLTGLTGTIQKAGFLLNEHSPTILTGMGVIGAVSTAYLSGRASFKAAKLLEEEKQVRATFASVKPMPEPSRFEKVKQVWRLYIPPVVAGVTTVASIIFANRLASKKMAALVLSAGISERALQEYKTKVIEKFGDRENTKVRDEIAQERIRKHPANTEIIIAGSGDVLCYDMLTGRYFVSSAEKIRKAENRINHDLNHSMYASLSEFYDEVGLPPTTYTDMVGWNGNENLEVQISTVMSDDEKPCLAIDFTPPPSSEYRRNLYD